MKSPIKNRSFLIVVFSAGLVLFQCVSEKQQSGEKILVDIGGKTISKAEFIRRAEYTIRPPYARGNSNIDKKIIINSLIAEKLLALEAGEDNPLTRNPQFQRYIQGRKEQAMRQWLLKMEGADKVELDSTRLKNAYRAAGRNYRVQYMNLKDEDQARRIHERLNQTNADLESVYRQLGGRDSLPQRTIKWQQPEPEAIKNALFEQPSEVKEGDLLPLIEVGENEYLIVQVADIVESVPMSTYEQQKRWNEVRERLMQEASLDRYATFVSEVMKGKTIEFVPQTFRKLVELVGPMYLVSDKSKENLFLDQSFGRESRWPGGQGFEAGLAGLRDKPLFNYEGRVWTVAEFEEEYERHPLVFRKNNFSKGEFAEQFKLAIVDMMRDRELTNVAYERGYDQVDVVKRYTGMWEDALLAMYQRNAFLEQKYGPGAADSLASIQAVRTHLNPYIDELQAKYGNRIGIDTEIFNKIELTNIDMFVTQDNVPFPVVVPSFPLLTTDHRLDYGKRME